METRGKKEKSRSLGLYGLLKRSSQCLKCTKKWGSYSNSTGARQMSPQIKQRRKAITVLLLTSEVDKCVYCLRLPSSCLIFRLLQFDKQRFTRRPPETWKCGQDHAITSAWALTFKFKFECFFAKILSDFPIILPPHQHRNWPLSRGLLRVNCWGRSSISAMRWYMALERWSAW